MVYVILLVTVLIKLAFYLWNICLSRRYIRKLDFSVTNVTKILWRRHPWNDTRRWSMVIMQPSSTAQRQGVNTPHIPPIICGCMLRGFTRGLDGLVTYVIMLVVIREIWPGTKRLFMCNETYTFILFILFTYILLFFFLSNQIFLSFELEIYINEICNYWLASKKKRIFEPDFWFRQIMKICFLVLLSSVEIILSKNLPIFF